MGATGFYLSAVAAQAAALGCDVAADTGHAVGVAEVGNQADVAAVADTAWCCIGMDAAALVDLVTCLQADGAAVVHQAVGFQAAAVVDDAALQAVGGLCREDDEAAGCQHGLAVVHQGRHGGGGYQNMGQAVSHKLQIVGLARSHCHRAHLCQHHAAVAHLGCQQGDVAVQTGSERAFVDHAPCCAIAAEAVAAGHEVGIADAVRGGHQAAHVHAGAGGKGHAAGVADEYLAVGVDLAKDLAGVGVKHPVERDAASAWLVEVDACLAADIEGVPVQGGAAAGLVDGQRGRTL